MVGWIGVVGGGRWVNSGYGAWGMDREMTNGKWKVGDGRRGYAVKYCSWTSVFQGIVYRTYPSQAVQIQNVDKMPLLRVSRNATLRYGSKPCLSVIHVFHQMLFPLFFPFTNIERKHVSDVSGTSGTERRNHHALPPPFPISRSGERPDSTLDGGPAHRSAERLISTQKGGEVFGANDSA